MPPRVLAVTTLLVISLSGIGAVAFGRDPHAALRASIRARIEIAGGDYLGTEGVVLQATLADCGPAALASLLARLGRPVATESLAVLAGTTARGTRLGGLAYAANAVGVRAYAVRLSEARRQPDQLSRRLPIVAWVDRGHFVAVTGQRRNGDFVVLDPQVGVYSLPFGALVGRWTGEALVLE